MPDSEFRINDMRLRVSGIEAASAPQFARTMYEQLVLRCSQVTSETRLGALHLRVPALPNADAARLAASVADEILRKIE